jgi:hypothetical protein
MTTPSRSPSLSWGTQVSGAGDCLSLSEAMGTTHFVLNQANDVLRREREDINKE